ncbi:MAG: 4Fe-4S binding protein [Oscillospiraceae bacterium]|jgi:2-oxoglutarate ferredoxin oxidoreductase subunit delta|nr:4Fe-4S binding protein [Oscillospiraceae bacterium]
MAGFIVTFDGEVCKGCELCAAFCPKGLIAPSDVINNKGYSPASISRQEECVGCQSCALVCPDGAVAIYKEGA